MTTITTDADLVAAHLGGDRGALAGIYDRYADTLYDTAAAMLRDRQDAADVVQDVFVVTAERLDQLRDPTRLKPWLFAILRNEVYRRTGVRRRSVATDFTEPAAEMHLPPDHSDAPDAIDAIAHEELALLVRDAAGGLDPRDQLVLEYSVRQGLEGDDLAQALGVSNQQSYSMLHRMRQRAERSLGALCVARAGRRECAELDQILTGWDGQFSVLIRKRVSRHIDNCDTCERSRRTLAPIALFGAAPALQAPAALRDRVLSATEQGGPPARYGFDAPGGFPSAFGHARRLAMWFAIAAIATVGAVAATVWVLADDDPDVLATADVQSAPPTVPSATNPDATDPDASEADGDMAEGADPALAVTATTDPAAPTSPGTLPASTEPAAPGATSATSAPSTPSTPGATSPASTEPDDPPSATSTTDPNPAPTTTIVQVGPPPTVPPETTGPTTAPTTAPAPTTSTTAPPTTTAPPPGALTLSAGSVDFGTTTDTVTVTLTNDGGQSLDWTAQFGPSGFRKVSGAFAVTPAAGSLPAGASTEVSLAIDRDWPSEGPLGSSITFAAVGTDATLALIGEIARAPRIDAAQTPVQICAFNPAGARNRLTAVATVFDESSVKVVYEAVDQYDNTVAVAMTERSGAWYASIVTDDLPQDSIWTWTITATDAHGNASTVRGTTEVVPTFC